MNETINIYIYKINFFNLINDKVKIWMIIFNKKIKYFLTFLYI
jgi:hypothetical protein